MFKFFKRLSEPEPKKDLGFNDLQAETFFANITPKNLKPLDISISEMSRYIRQNISGVQKISRAFQIDLNNVGNNTSLNQSYSLPSFNPVSPTLNQNSFGQMFYGKIHGYITPQIPMVVPPDLFLSVEQFSIDSLNSPQNIGYNLFNHTFNLPALFPNRNYYFPSYNSEIAFQVVEPKKILTAKLTALSINNGNSSWYGIRVFMDGYLINSSRST